MAGYEIRSFSLKVLLAWHLNIINAISKLIQLYIIYF